ncbi:MAG: hypothetical protein ACRDGW_01270 [Actinomycetota bacterium]
MGFVIRTRIAGKVGAMIPARLCCCRTCMVAIGGHRARVRR